MNNNIEKLIDKILNNYNCCKKLAELSSMEEVYNYCLSIQDGYTIEEFEEFLENINIDEHKIFEDKDGDIDLKNVSGGVSSDKYVKVLAYSLALLTMASPISQYAYASDAQPVKTQTRKYTKSIGSREPSFWEKYKKRIVKVGMLGAAVLGMFWLYRRSTQSPINSKNDVSGDNKKSSNWYSDFKNKAGGILPSVAVFAGMWEMMSDLSSLSKKINNISTATWPLKQLWNQFLDFRRYIDRKLDTRELPLEESFENLDLLFEEVKGQYKAKEQIKSIVYGILHRKNQAKLTGRKYEHADVLYFAGPSGVGKTLMARGLAKYKILTANTEPFYISASEIDKGSSESVVEQLFGVNRYYGGSYGYSGYGNYDKDERNVITKPKNLVKYINENPGGVIIIDEYDKMWSETFDEIFRTAVDNGRINVKGQTIDCSGMTFILTSNESKKSLEGGNQDFEKDSEADDGTGSRTIIKHDKSFINRLQPVEFENLSSVEYKQIIEKEINQDLVEYWANPEVKDLQVVLDDKCLEAMAKVVEHKNQGARYINKLKSDLFRDISIKVFDAEVKEKDYYRGKKLFVQFNPETEVFTLSDN